MLYNLFILWSFLYLALAILKKTVEKVVIQLDSLSMKIKLTIV